MRKARMRKGARAEDTGSEAISIVSQVQSLHCGATLACGPLLRSQKREEADLTAPEWLWIPITLGAAFAQTMRNAAQRHLTPVLGTLGATLVRFLYGLPFALAWLAIVVSVGGYALPPVNVTFGWWV